MSLCIMLEYFGGGLDRDYYISYALGWENLVLLVL